MTLHLRPSRLLRNVVPAAACAALVSALLSAAPARSQIAAAPDDTIDNPPAAAFGQFGESVAAAAERTSTVPPDLFERDGEVEWTAYIRKVEGRIFNPRSGSYDSVSLRAYQGNGTDPAVPFVAPTVNLKPGETFRLTLVNQLPDDDSSCPGPGNVNIPHCFNSTNMHTHGLWISPTGNSDNVLLRINPGTTFPYEYNLPLDHPTGTFWYHPHLHGSTALQVSSGMAGALIIRGDRLPGRDRSGDLDTLLRTADGTRFRERIVLLQQIPYACRDAGGAIKTDSDGFWVCEADDIGTIDGYDQFGPGSWPASGRYTTINGRTVPTFDGGVAGSVERWRLIHAGVRDSVKFQFHRLRPEAAQRATAAAYSARSEADQAAFVREVCEATPMAQFSVATDGLTRDALREQTVSELHPGYREDLLVVFPEPGTYCLVDAEAPGNETVAAEDTSRQLLGFVRVEPGPSTDAPSPTDMLRTALIAAAETHMPADVRADVVADLEAGLGLSAFVPHASLEDAVPDGKQTLGFNIDVSAATPVFEIGSLDANGNLSDAKPYDPRRIDRSLPLGSIQDWELRSFLAGHPFHIHVNPFQILEVLDADGNDVSNHDPNNQSIYAGLKGAWKDTLFVTQQRGSDGVVPYRIRVRTQYRRYIGEFVLHCHILDHEDQGMMQNVRIGLPDRHGGILQDHH